MNEKELVKPQTVNQDLQQQQPDQQIQAQALPINPQQGTGQPVDNQIYQGQAILVPYPYQQQSQQEVELNLKLNQFRSEFNCWQIIAMILIVFQILSLAESIYEAIAYDAVIFVLAFADLVAAIEWFFMYQASRLAMQVFCKQYQNITAIPQKIKLSINVSILAFILNITGMIVLIATGGDHDDDDDNGGRRRGRRGGDDRLLRRILDDDYYDDDDYHDDDYHDDDYDEDDDEEGGKFSRVVRLITFIILFVLFFYFLYRKRKSSQNAVALKEQLQKDGFLSEDGQTVLQPVQQQQQMQQIQPVGIPVQQVQQPIQNTSQQPQQLQNQEQDPIQSQQLALQSDYPKI